MSVAAIMLVKDEADIIKPVVEHTLTQVDILLAADNGSTDDTRRILGNCGATVIDDPEVGFFQSRKTSALAEQAREMGADWVVPIDGDELWYARDDGRLGDFLGSLPDEILLAQAVLFDHVATAQDRGSNPIKRMPWRRAAANPLNKVACRAKEGLVIEPGNHHAFYPDVWPAPAVLDAIVVHHFPYRTPEQFIRRVRNGAAGYAATNGEVSEEHGSHKRAFGRILDEQGEDALREIFQRDFYFANPRTADLVRDPLIR